MGVLFASGLIGLAVVFDRTIRTIRPTGLADVASVEYKPVMSLGKKVFGDVFYKGLLSG